MPYPLSAFGLTRLAPTLLLALALLTGQAGCRGESKEELVASAQALASKRDFRGAVVQYKSALQKDGQDAELRFALGKALVDAGDPANGALELSKALDQKVSAQRVVPELARAMLASGDYKKLTANYSETTFSDRSATASLKASLALAWLALGDRSKGQDMLTAALAAQPDHGPSMSLQARLMAARGEPAAALVAVEKLLAKDPQLTSAWHLLGEIQAQNPANKVKAIEAYKKALAIDGNHVPSHVALVHLYMASKDMAAARAQANTLREALPKHPQTAFVDAELALQERDFIKARELTQTLLKVAPNHTGVLQLAGTIEGQTGALLVAESHFAKALQIAPGMVPTRLNLAQTQLRLGQGSKALDTLQPLLSKDTGPAEAFAMAGEAQLMMGQDAASEASFQKAIKMAPDNLQVRTALALSALANGKDNSALGELNALSALDKGNHADMALVAARLKRREFDQALTVAQAMVKKNPDSAAGYNALGRVQIFRKESRAAREAFEQALKLDPMFFSATSNLAGLDMLENDPARAQSRLEGAIKLNPRNTTAYLTLAELMVTRGTASSEVNRVLTQAIKAAPGEVAARLMLVNRLLVDRDHKEALNTAQDAAAALPNNPQVLDGLGRALAESGDRQQAITTFRRLATLDTSSGMPYVRLADVHRSMGDNSLAESNFKKALDVQIDLLPAQTGLVDLLLSTNRHAEALQVAQRLQKRQPVNSTGFLFEAAIQLRKKAPDAAIAAYRAGLVQLPRAGDLALALHKTLSANKRLAEADQLAAKWTADNPNDLAFEYQLATSAIQRGDLVGAEKRLNAVLLKRPGHALALNNLAWVMVVQGKPGAVAIARRAVAMMPSKPALMDTLAMAMAAENQVSDALDLQKQAVALAPLDTGLRLNLAKIAIQAGDKTLARKELTALESAGAASPLRGEVLKLMTSL